ncbi:hypothetical protein, partial [Escherichia coli]|uniref:hypothetical protein n=1 Tax=Escherichia coli TaxID=562 RepID=UPI0029F578D6
FDGGFAWINLFFWFRISLLLLFQLACFGTGNSSFDGGFAWINLFFWFRISLLLLFQLARFGACNSRFDGSFARIDLLFWGNGFITALIASTSGLTTSDGSRHSLK